MPVLKLDRRLLREAPSVRLDLALTIGVGLLAAILLVGQAAALSRIVSQVFLAGGTLEAMVPLLAGLLILSLTRAGLAWAGEVTAGRTAIRSKGRLRQQLMAHLLALGPARLAAHGERTGELVTTAVEGVEALDAYFRQYLPQIALAALVPLTILVFVFPLDWISGLVLLLTAPLIPLFMGLIGRSAEALNRRQWVSLSRMAAHFLETIQGLTTLKLFGRSREQVQAIARVSDQFRQVTMGVLRVTFLSALVLEMVATISTAVVAVQIGLRLLYGYLSFEQALFVLLLAPEFYLPFRLLGARYHAGMAGLAAAERIFAVLETEPVADSPPVGVGPPVCPASLTLPAGLHLRFDAVHYSYEGSGPALKGVSFYLAPGDKVALVGPSGAGKSTVVNLLLRFIEPDQGTIRVGGVPLADLPLEAWRNQVAWVPQNPYLFQGTVADNLRLSRPQASPDEVVWAARQAHAHAFIEALPHGYDTQVGERGLRLSGGEAQRLALARAFLKDAPILVLDEATANLDPETEDQIRAAMAGLLKGRTALLIAHRLGTVSLADRVLVMAGGQIVQEGTPAALSEQKGLYRSLVQAYQGALAGGDLAAPVPPFASGIRP